MSAIAWLQLLIIVFLAGVLLSLPGWSTSPWPSPWSWPWRITGAATPWTASSYTRRFHYTRGFPGEKTEVRSTVVNNKLLPVSWLRTSDSLAGAGRAGGREISLRLPTFPEQGFLVNLYSLRWHERITRTYPLLFRKRGIYEIGPLASGSRRPVWAVRSEARSCPNRVPDRFPEMLPLERLNLPAEDPFGDRRARKPLFEDPSQAMGIRPYHPGGWFPAHPLARHCAHRVSCR